MAEIHAFPDTQDTQDAQGPWPQGPASGVKRPLMSGRRSGFWRAVRKSVTRWIPDRLCIAYRFKAHFGFRPNLVRPETFNEKICYRRLHPEPVFSPLSDKLEVRHYVSRTIGDEYLLPLYPVSSPLARAEYEALPERFVLKGNHGSGYNLVVHDKQDYAFEDVRALTDYWLGSNFYLASRELHYRDIRPQLMCEKMLLDEQGGIPKDYKFYCFRPPGQAPRVFIEVTHDRFTDFHVDYYDTDWQLMDVVETHFTANRRIEKPAGLDRAVELALDLSRGFGFARVDFYLVGGAIYFGEITFTPTGGLKHFRSPAHDRAWGALFDHRPMKPVFGYRDSQGRCY